MMTPDMTGIVLPNRNNPKRERVWLDVDEPVGPRPPPRQDLRKLRGGEGRRLRHHSRRGVRAVRPERRGQDDDGRDPRRPPAAKQRRTGFSRTVIHYRPTIPETILSTSLHASSAIAP